MEAIAGIVAGATSYGGFLDSFTILDAWRNKKGVMMNLPKPVLVVVTLCAASLISASSTDEASRFIRQLDESLEEKQKRFSDDAGFNHLDRIFSVFENYFKIKTVPITHDASWFESHINSIYKKAVICVGGIGALRCFGPFKMILAANLTRAGPFAKVGWPATEKYATPSERNWIQEQGKLFGCHTCGIGSRYHPFYFDVPKEKRKFFADHIPPNKIVKQMKVSGKGVKQEFLPHCQKCSSKQGGLCHHHLSNPAKTTVSHSFFSRPQYYLAGGLLAGARTLLAPIY